MRYFNFIICYIICSINCLGQVVSDPTTLDKKSQLMNVDMQIFDLIENRENVSHLGESIPKLSGFALTHLDSLDVYEMHKDSVCVIVYAQNDKYKSFNEYCILYKDGISFRLMAAPEIYNADSVAYHQIDRRKFDFTIRTHAVRKNFLEGQKEELYKTGIRYILVKDYIDLREKRKK